MVTDVEILSLEDVKKEILEFCKDQQGKAAILEHIKVEVNKKNYSKFIVQLIDQRFITNGMFRKRSSENQQFVITQKGLNYLKAIS